MRFINSTDTKLSKDSVEHLFNINGEELQDQHEKVYSRSLSIDLGNDKIQNKFFIRVFNNMPLDPIGPDSRREIWNRTQLKQVSKTTFESYNSYLATRNKIFWTKANRSFING